MTSSLPTAAFSGRACLCVTVESRRFCSTRWKAMTRSLSRARRLGGGGSRRWPGSDTFHVGGGNNGQAITVVANDLLGPQRIDHSPDDQRRTRITRASSPAASRSTWPIAMLPAWSCSRKDRLRVFEILNNTNLDQAAQTALAQMGSVRYAVVLSRSPEETVQVTALPTLPKREEQRAGGAGVMLNGKLDGVILLFDRSNWFIPQYITVSAAPDTLGRRRPASSISSTVSSRAAVRRTGADMTSWRCRP